MRNKLVFPWIGGKYNHLWWLLPMLPESNHFIDVFGGSASVILNKKPCAIDTYNDINEEVCIFFKILRTDILRDKLIDAIILTPYSRQEFENSLVVNDSDDEIEKARKFFIKSNFCRSGLNSMSTVSNFSYSILSSRRGVSSNISKLFTKIDNLDFVINRLKTIQIENLNFIDLITRYNNKDCLLYCDPPYVQNTRKKCLYKYEFNDDYHIELCKLLNEYRGKWALSGYENDIYKINLDYKNKFIACSNTCGEGHKKRQEILWTNYDI